MDRSVRRGKFWRDGRGLSDLMAVLLLLAVAVVAAAVTGSMILSKTPSGTPPTASLAIKAMNGKVYVLHNGGDSIALSDLKVYVYEYPNMTYVEGYGPREVGSLRACSGASTDCVVDGDPTGIFNNGDNIQLNVSPGNYVVKVEYKPLRQTISEAMVSVT